MCAGPPRIYTEALGRVWRWNFEHDDLYTLEGNERPRKNFEAGFKRLDDGSYGLWRDALEADHPPLYHVLRSGMVHEYRPKIGADMHLGYGGAPSLRKGVPEHTLAITKVMR